MAEGEKKKGLFASIDNGAEAAKLVREASFGFLGLAALQALVGLFVLPALLTDAVVLAILAGALMTWRSRTAAVLLLLASGVEAGVTVLNRVGVMHQGGRNIFLAAIMLVVAVRAVEATFKLHGRYRGQLAAAA